MHVSLFEVGDYIWLCRFWINSKYIISSCTFFCYTCEKVVVSSDNILCFSFETNRYTICYISFDKLVSHITLFCLSGSSHFSILLGFGLDLSYKPLSGWSDTGECVGVFNGILQCIVSELVLTLSVVDTLTGATYGLTFEAYVCNELSFKSVMFFWRQEYILEWRCSSVWICFIFSLYTLKSNLPIDFVCCVINFNFASVWVYFLSDISIWCSRSPLIFESSYLSFSFSLRRSSIIFTFCFSDYSTSLSLCKID